MESAHKNSRNHHSKHSTLMLGVIGVVYGDIGTSPLYTIKEIFSPKYGLFPSEENIFGILSLIFLSLFMIVSIKYVMLMMRVNNHGEGGMMALLALALRKLHRLPRLRSLIILLGIMGTALFYGDGVITPAISVLSAVEGLYIAVPELTPLIIPLTLGILILLFIFQHKGSAAVSTLFGPIMVIWFLAIAACGLRQILLHPYILHALNPLYAIKFFMSHHWHGILVLGAVVLSITGAEALYADMGHFGPRAIRHSWFGFVFPALLLNYFGQGALLLSAPSALINPFYLLVPNWGMYGMLILATMATIIASQAVISGAFSITKQAIQLGFLPRMNILHTSAKERGQIYIPFINRLMLAVIIALVLYFPSSSLLAAAYGFAVTGTMLITSIIAIAAVQYLWHLRFGLSVLIMSFFLPVEISFFTASTFKIHEGGWLPLLIGIMIFTLMTTWKKGRDIAVASGRFTGYLKFKDFQKSLKQGSRYQTVPGTAIYLTHNRYAIAPTLLHNLKHNKVLHERIVFLTIITRQIPYVAPEYRYKLEKLNKRFYRILLYYGFKETPNIPEALEECIIKKGLNFNIDETSFFVGHAIFVPSPEDGMELWREKLFAWMARNSWSATAFLQIPNNRVIELGTQIKL